MKRFTRKIVTESPDPYQLLANAIVVQAAKDYRKALRKQRKDPENILAMIRIEEVEEFFFSEWYRLLTTVDANKIIHLLREEVAA